jgi:predicted DNA-binding transcriptional regulator AlpA
MTVLSQRMLKLKEAAAYCGLPMSRFRALCSVQPVVFTERLQRWDRHDLDSWIDSFKSGTFHDTDAILARLG